MSGPGDGWQEQGDREAMAAKVARADVLASLLDIVTGHGEQLVVDRQTVADLARKLDALTERVTALEAYRVGADEAGRASAAAIEAVAEAVRVAVVELTAEHPLYIPALGKPAGARILAALAGAPEARCRCAECEQERDLVAYFAGPEAPPDAPAADRVDAGPVADAVALIRRGKGWPLLSDLANEASRVADALAAHEAARVERDARVAALLREATGLLWDDGHCDVPLDGEESVGCALCDVRAILRRARAELGGDA